MRDTPFLLDGVFPKRDPLAGVSADEVGPEIAAALGLAPSAPPVPMLDGWPSPEPLAESLPDVMQFDLELMPESLRPLVKDVAERMQVPLDFPAVAAIATLAGVTNRRAMIQPKRNDDTWIVVPNLWGGIVAPPGMLKSPVISAMTQPARAIESEWRKEHGDEERIYQTAWESQKLEEAAWEQEYRKAAKRKDNKERPTKPESALVQPMLRRLITSDPRLRNFISCFQKIRRVICSKSGMS